MFAFGRLRQFRIFSLDFLASSAFLVSGSRGGFVSEFSDALSNQLRFGAERNWDFLPTAFIESVPRLRGGESGLPSRRPSTPVCEAETVTASGEDPLCHRAPLTWGWRFASDLYIVFGVSSSIVRSALGGLVVRALFAFLV